MESLYARATATDVVACALPSGRIAQLRRLHVHFGRATPDRLREGTLARTYTSKPLVSFNGAAMFGEIALLKWLEVDGWQGAWLDTFHGRKLWRDMPTLSVPTVLTSEAQRLYDHIAAENGGRASGAFDVMAWRNDHIIFLEYKGPGDRSNRNESAWIDAALRAGVPEADLFIVVADS